MRHKNSGRGLSRKSPHRRAMYRNLAASLLRMRRQNHVAEGEGAAPRRGALDHAREGRRRLATASSRSTPTRRQGARQALRGLPARASRRPGGYLRIIKMGFRRGDSAPPSPAPRPKAEAERPEPRSRA